MPHTSNVRDTLVEEILERTVPNVINTILRAEEVYQDLLEAYQYAGGTAAGFAELIFNQSAGATTTEQQTKAADYIAAAQALHSLYTSADFAALRRVS